MEAFRQLGVADADQRLDKYHQTGIFQELEEGKITPDEFQVKLGQLCGGRTPSWEETRQAWLGYFTGLDERLLDCLKELRKRYKLFVLSNTNPYVMDWACSPAFSSKGKPLSDYFDKLYLSYQIGVTKPDRQIFDFLIADATFFRQNRSSLTTGPATYRQPASWVSRPTARITVKTGAMH